MNRTTAAALVISSSLLCYLSIYDTAGSLNADVLSPLSLSLELREGLGKFRYWNDSGWTGWFPDILSVTLITQLLAQKYTLVANIAWGLLQIGTFQYCNIKLIKFIIQEKEDKGRASLLASASIVLFFALSDRRLLTPAIYPVHHFSAFLLSLFLIVLYFEILSCQKLSANNKAVIFLSAASVVLLTLSDPFFLVFGSFPLITTHLFFRFSRTHFFIAGSQDKRCRTKQLDLFCCLIVINSAIGYGLYKITPVSNSAYLEKSLEASLSSMQSFFIQLIGSPQTLLLLAIVVAFTFFTFRRSQSSNFYKKYLSLQLNHSFLEFYILFIFSSTVFCIAIAVGFYGLFSDVYHFRYIQNLIFCPPVLVGIALWLGVKRISLKANCGKNLKYSALSILVAMTALNLVLSILIKQGYEPRNNAHVQNLACIQKLGIDHYAAEYWWAKPVHVLSGGKVMPMQLNADADYYPWLNSDRWYQDLNQLDGTLGVLIKADGKQLIDSQQVISKTSASIPKQCGNLEYLLSPD